MAVNEQLLPGLAGSGYELHSDPTDAYNCIAFAAGDTDAWWDPDESYYWPHDLPRDYKPSTLVMLYEGIGFDLCDDGSHEDGYEKVAIYGRTECWEHAALQQNNGRWVSKLGPDDDIIHNSHVDLEGDLYGQAIHFLKRRIASTA